LKLPSLTQLVAIQIAKANPAASNEDIVNELISVIEDSVLPNVLRGMKPIPRPSITQLKFQELMMKRAPRRRKEYYERLHYFYRLANQFDYIRAQLEEYPLSGTTYPLEPIQSLSKESTVPLFLQEEPTSQWDGKRSESVETEPYKPPFRERWHYDPWISSEERKKVRPEQFSFSLLGQVQERTVSDPVFERIVEKIETGVRSSFAPSKSKLHLQMQIRRDQEIADWEKLIVTVDSEETDFDKKMDLWNKIDAEVMKAIGEVEARATPDERKIISSIKRKIFTDMKLP